MPDNIYQDKFFYRTPAWHRKGHKLPEGATLDEAKRLAGHDFTVDLVEVMAGGILLDDHFGVRRIDNNTVLGVVGSKYRIIQPNDVYDVIRPVVGNSAAQLECGGMLGSKGQVMWILARFGEDFYVPGVMDDVISNYWLIFNSFNGSTKLIIRSTKVRVVCQNTLDASFRNYSPLQIEILHLPGAREQIKLAHKSMMLATRHTEELREVAGVMAKAKMTARQVSSFLRKLFPSAPEERGEDVTKITAMKRARVEILFTELDRNNLPGMERSFWAMYNAVVEYADHERPVRQGVDELNRLWLGATYDLKAEAARLLVKQVFDGK